MSIELDIKIAEQIMGYTRLEGIGFIDEPWFTNGIVYVKGPPPYSTNTVAAFDVVNKIPLRFCIIKESDNSNERRYKCWFTREDGESGYPVSYSDSLAEAICKAALKTVDKLEK